MAMIAAAGSVLWVNLTSDRRQGPSSRRPEVQIPREPLTIDDAPVLGMRTARIALVLFSDFQCPFCRRFAIEVLPQLKRQYVDSGQLQVAFRHLPLDGIHPRARAAAEAAECAARQDGFWPFHDRLFLNASALEVQNLRGHAETIGLNVAKFDTCLNGEAVGHVQRDQQIAEALGLGVTPTLMIGVVELRQQSLMRVREVIVGARPLEVVTKSVEVARLSLDQ
jgi:protein-disulfide isomerase